jgi:hypothetical protein
VLEGAGIVPATPIRLARHAGERVDAGEVRAEWIEATIRAPDWTAPDVRRPAITLFLAIAAFGRRVLRVAHRPDGVHILVVTACFDRGAKR